jgi:hypothetical protein
MGRIDDDVDERARKTMIKIACGLSRVCYHLQEYNEAIYLTYPLVQEQRQTPGVHKLLDMPLPALANNAATPPPMVHGYETTLQTAIEVAYKGLVYEAPWYHLNKLCNKAFLQDLLHQAAAQEASSESLNGK